MTHKQMPLDAIEAYRAFTVEGDTLVSPIAWGYEWAPGVNTSQCRRCGDTPKFRCRCGFYSYRSEEIAVEEWGEESGTLGLSVAGVPVGGDRDDDLVLATIKNAGVIWRGPRGYRSQYAQVSGLLTDHPDDYGAVLEAYEIIAVRPGTRDDRGLCRGVILGFKPGPPGLVALDVMGITRGDASADFLMDPHSDAYMSVATAGVGTSVDITFEHRGGERLVRHIEIEISGDGRRRR